MRIEKKSLEYPSKWHRYLIGLGLVALATSLGHLVHTFFDPTNIMMIYLLCVTISAAWLGLGPSIMVSILVALAYDFFFVTSFYTFAVDDTQYIFTLAVLLLVSIIVSYLTSRIRQQTEVVKQRERETAALYALGRDLAVSVDLQSYIEAVVRRIKEALGYDVIILLPDTAEQGRLITYTGGNEANFNENEISIATWFFQHQEKARYDTNTYCDVMTRYLRLVTARGIVGIMVLRAPDVADEKNTEQERLLMAYADLIAVALEGIQLAEELQNTRVLKATERLQGALLNAISHDLRTPLVSIIGTLSSLQEEGMNLDDNSKENLIQVASEEADRLNHFITNLLDESRIEAGAIKLSRQPLEIQDLVGATLEQFGSRTGARSIKIDIPADIDFISVDFGLIAQTLYNILDNAMKYSPVESPIEIRAYQLDRDIYIEVTDYGVGIPEQDLPNIFDKFYRIRRHDNIDGTGLGLSISKGIVEAHGGSIEAKRGPKGGTVITVRLPVDSSTPEVAQTSYLE